ncbi:hypothetical protein L798_10724 [Zootermopsis nevadensis]|uniref:Uncharacterized protein n=1 Tax=Zootermopsis nevadensis TaxID=136037 RepID=A0A067QZS2_ZOONE|nr:hypothetical protein L798_10724 [Zootermopsis nevadensis]
MSCARRSADVSPPLTFRWGKRATNLLFLTSSRYFLFFYLNTRRSLVRSYSNFTNSHKDKNRFNVYCLKEILSSSDLMTMKRSDSSSHAKHFTADSHERQKTSVHRPANTSVNHPA